MSLVSITARELGATFANRDASLFVGAGVSCSCGLPSWNDIIKQMKKELRRFCPPADRAALNEFLRSNDATVIAGVYKNQRGTNEYFRFLRSHFRNREYKCSTLLHNVTLLPVQVLFTTNYDKLLETSSRRIGIREDPVVVIEPDQIPCLSGDERRIIKLHGDIDHPRTIVLTEQDYIGFDDKCEALRQFLQGQLAFSTVVLVGFGLKDPNFARIYNSASRLVPVTGPRVIALMTKQDPYELRKWQGDGLTINNFDEYEDIPRFLATVRRYSNGLAR